MGKLVFTLKAIGRYQVLCVRLSSAVVYSHPLLCAFYKIHSSTIKTTDVALKSPLVV